MASNVVRFPAPTPQQKPKKTKKAKGLMPDGRYRCMLEIDRHPDGKRNRIPFYGKSYADAKKQADAYRKKLDEGRNLAGANQTVAEWAAKWLETYGSGAGFSAIYSYALYGQQLGETALG